MQDLALVIATGDGQPGGQPQCHGKARVDREQNVWTPRDLGGSDSWRMQIIQAQRKYPDELRERAVKMVFEVRELDGKGRGELVRVARQLGVHPEALRTWVRQAEIDGGIRPGTTRRNRGGSLSWNAKIVSSGALCDIEGGECVFREGTRPQASALVGFIDSYRDRFGVEAACAVLEFPVSTYYAAKKRERRRRVASSGMSG